MTDLDADTDTDIAFVHGRRVWDSRGRPTVEVDVLLECGAVGRAIAPAGASTGSFEALELRDGGAAFGGYDVTKAVAHVNGAIAHAVTGLDAADQAALDEAMIALDGTPNKSRLGANAIVAVSMAAAHAAAAAAGEPLYRYLGDASSVILPLPQIQIFGGGAHAGRRVDIQDFMIMCPSAGSFAEALDRTAEVYRAAGALMKEAGTLAGVADEGGWWPGPRHRARRVHPGQGRVHRARHRRLGVRPRRPLQAGAGGQGAGQRGHDPPADRLAGPLPDRLDRGPAGRG
jgi:enolase